MLSKSQFIRGVKCPKSLWLYKNSDIPRDEPDEAREALFETGYSVGELAKSLYPGGREVPFDSSDFAGMARQTREWIGAGVETIYEATFRSEEGFAMVDILHSGENGWEMIEVKASSSVKEYHLYDAAFQYRVLCDCGIVPASVAIAHIDSSYVRGEELEPERLFALIEITEEVLGLQGFVGEKMAELEAMLAGPEPQIGIGEWCGRFYECDYHGHCWAGIPEPSIFDLYRMRSDRKFALYREGIVELGDLPADYPLNEAQRVQVETTLEGRVHIEREKIRAFLGKLEAPIRFLDFETFQEAIPSFPGQHPYMQMPFQYSLHILREDGRLEHREYLGDPERDPRRELAERLLEDLGPSGSIVAYNEGFEIARIRELAEALPEYSRALLGLVDRFVDLIEPFRNLGYCHPDFRGSFSIKSVLPAIFHDDPELDYARLGSVQNGGDAMNGFLKLRGMEDEESREALRQDLLAYCRLDTLAMVKIVEYLRGLVDEKGE